MIYHIFEGKLSTVSPEFRQNHEIKRISMSTLPSKNNVQSRNVDELAAEFSQESNSSGSGSSKIHVSQVKDAAVPYEIPREVGIAIILDCGSYSSK